MPVGRDRQSRTPHSAHMAADGLELAAAFTSIGLEAFSPQRH